MTKIGDYVKLASEAYREASKTPILTAARLEQSSSSPGLLSVATRWSQPNLATNQKMTFTKTLLVQETGTVFTSIHDTPPVLENGREMTAFKGQLQAIVRSNKVAEDPQTVELWNSGSLQSSYNMKDIDIHGKIYTDSEFGSLHMSEDSSRLLYIAEKKKEKNRPFLHQGEIGENVSVGQETQYQEDWGEQLVGKANPVIVVLDMNSEQPSVCKLIQGVPEGLSPGLVRWWQGGIVGVAYRTSPRRLGKVYCSNRPSVLFHLTLDGTWTQITPSADSSTELGIQGLTVGPSAQLVWLERSLESTNDDIYPGPHGAAFRLMTMANLGEDKIEVVSHQQTPYLGLDPSQFCGIFVPNIADRCWLSNEKLILSCPQGETMLPLIIDIGRCTAVVPSHTSCKGVTVLDFVNGNIIGVRSDPLTPHHLVIARINGETDDLQFFPISSVPSSPVAGLTWSSFLVSNPPTPDNVTVPALPYTAHYIGPSEGSPSSVPLIVWPHGGPHSVITTEFKTIVMFYCSLGYGVLFVNYRGSVGFGEDNVLSLLGNVGDMDVKDCHHARDLCLTKFPHLSPSKCVLLGGSHGGFLVTHLAGQYPDMYKGVVARNPVTNIASMTGITDIPDWTFNESGLTYSCLPANPTNLTGMWEKSPVAHLDKVTAPVFLMIGKNDLRVPPSQGIEYFHAMKTLGKEVKMNIYDDNHPLAKVENDVNVMISAAVFYNECLNK